MENTGPDDLPFCIHPQKLVAVLLDIQSSFSLTMELNVFLNQSLLRIYKW